MHISGGEKKKSKEADNVWHGYISIDELEDFSFLFGFFDWLINRF